MVVVCNHYKDILDQMSDRKYIVIDDLESCAF